MSVASRCAVFKAANQALNDGAKLEDMKFAPVMVMVSQLEKGARPPESQPSPAEFGATLRQSPKPSAGPDEQKPGEKKPWWQLW